MCLCKVSDLTALRTSVALIGLLWSFFSELCFALAVLRTFALSLLASLLAY